MADEFHFLWSECQNYIAEADASLMWGGGGKSRHGLLEKSLQIASKDS